MYLPLTGTIPIDQTAIKIIDKPPAIVQKVKPELTVKEKVASNYYKCDESKFWIRADNAQCLAKQVQTTTIAKSTENQSEPIKNSSGSTPGHYTAGQCTGFVASKRFVPNGWGNATDWKYHAQQSGWTVSTTPIAGAIAWRYGHVAYVESVNSDGTIILSEANYDWVGSVRTIEISSAAYEYLY